MLPSKLSNGYPHLIMSHLICLSTAFSHHAHKCSDSFCHLVFLLCVKPFKDLSLYPLFYCHDFSSVFYKDDDDDSVWDEFAAVSIQASNRRVGECVHFTLLSHALLHMRVFEAPFTIVNVAS